MEPVSMTAAAAVLAAVAAAVAIFAPLLEMGKAGADAIMTNQVKKAIRKMAKPLADKISKNAQVRDKLIQVYQEKGAGQARAYLLQSPFGSHMKILQNRLVETLSNFKKADSALAKEAKDLESKRDQLDRIAGDVHSVETALGSRHELENWKQPDSTASDAILNHLSTENKPLQPKPTTTAPTQQVQGGLKGNQ